MKDTRILLVDDDEVVRMSLSGLLQHCGFHVTCAANVPDALKLISGSHTFDVLLTDLHMPGAGDGLTVASAMRHANPQAVTLLLSACPRMAVAAQAILLQIDQILVKPVDLPSLIHIIQRRVARLPLQSQPSEGVAAILERSVSNIIEAWFDLVQTNNTIMSIPLSRELRCAHLSPFLAQLIATLQSPKPLGKNKPISTTAIQHGCDRLTQGYSAAMLVDEFRMLQASIFQTLETNFAGIDCSLLLSEVMTVADEIHAELAQAMASYVNESLCLGAFPCNPPHDAPRSAVPALQG